MYACGHAFGIPVKFHCRLHKVLVDGGQDGVQRVEICVEEHFVSLDLEGTSSPTISLRQHFLASLNPTLRLCDGRSCLDFLMARPLGNPRGLIKS